MVGLNSMNMPVASMRPYAAGMTKTTLYLDRFQFKRRASHNNTTGGADTLQFAVHEEGRVRWAFHKWLNGYSAYAWQYDHLPATATDFTFGCCNS